MADTENFWVDGEKIPDSHLKEVFQTPPDAASPFLRSALVIGARGAGKTTLFRHLKESHTGVGVHLSLAAQLGCIHKETGRGPLAKECPPHLQRSLPGKTISLLAVALAEKVIRKGVNVPLEMLLECLPPPLRSQTKTLDAGGVTELQRQIAQTSVSSFDALVNGRPLPDFMSACGRASGLARGPLLVLFDRADQVNAQCLLPVFELLDQSSDYTALIAMRPGHTNHAIEDIAGNVVPGDHYDVVHLGIQPSSPAWHTFVESSVRAQAEILGFIAQFRGIPDEVKRWITILSRDCVRTALELYARYLSAKPSAAETELVKAIEDAKQCMLIGTQASLQKYTSDFLGFANGIRNEAAKATGRVASPIYLTLKPKPREDLFSDTSSWLNGFVQESLRCGALCMLPGQRWVPGLHPTEVEVSPMLGWNKDDPKSTTPGPPIRVVRQDSEIRRSPYKYPKQPPTVFVAYRMNSVESKRFRQAIEDEIGARSDLSTLLVTDGRVPAGTAWPPEIRKRISRARAVIGDLTQVSSEVLFEMGFAYGLKKITIGAIADPGDRNTLPDWLSITQLGYFKDGAAVSALASSIAAHLREPELAKLPEPKQAVPELIVLLRRCEWNKQAYEQAAYVAQRAGLALVTYSLDDGTPYETVIQRSASANLLIVSMDGTEPDALMHYICGAVLAKPEAQVAGKKLHRRVLIIEVPSTLGKGLVAGSVARCPEAKIIRTDQRRVREICCRVPGMG